VNLLLFILAVIGLTHIVVDSEIAAPAHEWAKANWPWLARMMDCHQCAGFWCGVALGPIMSWNPLLWVVCGFAGSFLAQLGYWSLDALEACAKGKI
jgi:hypothetical protein